MIKPPPINKGDTVATVSPSFGGPSTYPHIFENGTKFLEDVLEVNVVEFPTTRMDA